MAPTNPTLIAALEDARRGETGPAERCLSAFEAGSQSGAWRDALQGGLWEADPHRPLPATERLLATASDDPHPSGEALVTCMTAALLLHDPGAARTCARVARVPGRGRWELARAWVLNLTAILLEDETALAPIPLGTLERHVADEGWADLTIRTAALKAFAMLCGGDVEGGLREARRASRMSQVEELPTAQYFAHMILARARRCVGSSHQAVRVLRSVAEVAPAQWGGWLAYETVMAGGPPAVSALDRLRGERATPSSFTVAAGAAAGLLSSEGTPLASNDAPELLRPFMVELEDLEVAVGLAPVGVASEAMQQWAMGSRNDAPHGLLGLGAVGEETEFGSPAAVIVGSTLPVRRWLRGALSRLAPADALVLDASTKGRERIELAVAALALACGALDEAQLFRQIYGFTFVRSTHRGVLDVLLSRIRKRIEPHASVTREGENISLQVERPMMVSDPRCRIDSRERVLHLVAREGRLGTSDAAERLGIPFRTAQDAIAQLIDEGALHKVREGRRVAYRVEDTTLSEPTRRKESER